MPFDIPLILPALEVFPLVEEFFASGQTDFDLDFPVFEVHFRWDQGKALFPGPAIEPLDLPFMQQKLARPERIMVVAVSVCVGTEVKYEAENLQIDDMGEAVIEE